MFWDQCTDFSCRYNSCAVIQIILKTDRNPDDYGKFPIFLRCLCDDKHGFLCFLQKQFTSKQICACISGNTQFRENDKTTSAVFRNQTNNLLRVIFHICNSEGGHSCGCQNQLISHNNPSPRLLCCPLPLLPFQDIPDSDSLCSKRFFPVFTGIPVG